VELIEVGHPSSSDSSIVIHTTCNTSTIIDLYSVGDKDEAWEMLSQKEVPFQQWLLLHGPQGKIVWVKAQFNGGAMVGAMCTSFFKKVQHWLQGQTKPSSRWLRMANGIIVPLQGVWKGVLELGGLRSVGEFEVFESGGSWEFLFGKPLLRCFKVLHDFSMDMVTIQVAQKSVVLHNDHSILPIGSTSMGKSPTCNVEE